MLIIGCDYHPSFQQISFVDAETGECGQRRLDHSSVEAESFYRGLRGNTVRVGMEASGHGRWFERLLAELGYELWIGDPAKIRAAEVRRQKTDRRDAEHLLQLLLEDRFPRIWVPTLAERDLRQLVLHRHRLVGLRTRVKNQLQAVALNEGMQRKKRLWSKKGREEFEQLRLLPWAGRRREDLLALLDGFDGSITQLSQAVEQEAKQLSDLVKELLDFSNPRKYERRPKNLADLVRRALKLVEGDLAKKNVQLELSLPDDLPRVLVNENEIVELTLNIVLNALESLPQGKRIILSLALARRGQEKFVRFTITDEGAGIEPEHLSRIFERYFTTKESGTGLGLAIVDRIVKAHGGKIDVDSTPDVGTTFKIDFPY